MLCTRIDEVLFVSFIVKKLTYKDCRNFFFFFIFLIFYIYVVLKSPFKSLLKLNFILRIFYMLKLNFNRLWFIFKEFF
jgi:hypothetical protein